MEPGFPATPSLGALTGRYELTRPLGRGGMCEVFAARHVHVGELVAIKVLRRELAGDTSTNQRFFREGQLAARLRSEHVVRVLDMGVTDPHDVPYIVLEYLEGTDLAAWIEKRGRLPVGEAAEYMMQVCEAIAEAHAIGIIHRDIKPSNLFVARAADGSPLVKVLDFGISRAALTADLRLTATSAILGTPMYMAPEVLESAKNAEVTSDIWSLGATLFELLTGRPPYTGDTPVEIYAHIKAQPAPSLQSVDASLPAPMSHVLDRCLQREPGSRFASIAEFADALAHAAWPPEVARARADRIRRVVQEAADRTERAKDGADTLLDPRRLATQPLVRAGSGKRGIWGILAAMLVGAALALILVSVSMRLVPRAATPSPGLVTAASSPQPSTLSSRPVADPTPASSVAEASPPPAVSPAKSTQPVPPRSTSRLPGTRPPASNEPFATDPRE